MFLIRWVTKPTQCLLICWTTQQRWCLLIHWTMMLFVDLLYMRSSMQSFEIDLKKNSSKVQRCKTKCQKGDCDGFSLNLKWPKPKIKCIFNFFKTLMSWISIFKKHNGQIWLHISVIHIRTSNGWI
jgi:hypothetical protein